MNQNKNNTKLSEKSEKMFKKYIFFYVFLIPLVFVYGMGVGQFNWPPHNTIVQILVTYRDVVNRKAEPHAIKLETLFDIEELRDGREIKHRIIIAGDGHYGQFNIPISLNGDVTNYDKIRHEMMINFLNHEVECCGVDFVVFNGDNVHDDAGLLNDVMNYYDQLNTTYYVVHGNHDYSTEDQWLDIWGYSWNHLVEKGNWAFILASSSFSPDSYDCID